MTEPTIQMDVPQVKLDEISPAIVIIASLVTATLVTMWVFLPITPHTVLGVSTYTAAFAVWGLAFLFGAVGSAIVATVQGGSNA